MPTISTSIRGTAMSSGARSIVRSTLTEASASDRAAIKRLFKEAAKADGNDYLQTNEAALVADAFEAVGGVSGANVAEVGASILDNVRALASARNADGIRSYFSSTSDLGKRIIQEFKSVIDAAGDKPVEFNTLIFAFTDKDIANEVLKLAEDHPNVTFRFITDWSQLPTSGGRQATRLHKLAQERGLDNILVKFKKDNPYVWSSSAGRAVYNHSASDGLNHHKGFVALVDGKPVRLATGSFNWSKTAAKSNWEDLFVFDDSNPVNRAVLAAYQEEFVSYFNDKGVANYDEARVHKRNILSALGVAHGRHPLAPLPTPTATPVYAPIDPSATFDVNHLSSANYSKLSSLVGSSAAKSVAYHLATYGRFASFDELKSRVSKVRGLSDARLEALEASVEFGDGRVPINQATKDELQRGLKITSSLATKIIALRKKLGDFESVEDLRQVPGMTNAIFDRIQDRVNDDAARAFFSARTLGAEEATTGYAPSNASRTVPVSGPDGEVTVQSAKLPVAIIDLMNRADEGDTAKVAMYGMSDSIEAFDSMVEAARRGVALRVVLNKAYNAGVANELKRLRDEEGLDIEVRFSKRTMHQKFGVVNDDCFFGSANMSGSATSEHSEDRFSVKNNAELAKELDDEFERLWAPSRSKPA